jgi:toxin YoeB
MEKIRHKKAQQKITELTKSVLKTPFHGIGKPEPLKHKMAGLWVKTYYKS